jgi:hypothetical protein
MQKQLPVPDQIDINLRRDLTQGYPAIISAIAKVNWGYGSAVIAKPTVS